MRPVLVTGRGGLGDAVYARPFVREAVRRYGDVHVATSWPWVFSDLPAVRPVKRLRGLKTQAYHGDLVPASTWTPAPRSPRNVSLRYRWEQLAKRSILTEMQTISGLVPQPLELDLPPLPESPLRGRYAVVRPPAIRVDFPAPAREPPPEYLAAASDALRARGLRVATIGAWVPGLEEPNGPPVPADVRYEFGELSIPEAFALVAGAAVVVCAPCWLIPACLATRTPLVAIAGGCGGRNNPAALVDARLDAGHVQWLLPTGYCMCRARHHGCPKEIPDFDERFVRALAEVAGARREAAA